MKIRLHIERLVLDGLPVTRAQGAILSNALQRELASAIGSGGLSRELEGGGVLPSLGAPEARLTERRPETMGAQIARSVYGAIGRSK